MKIETLEPRRLLAVTHVYHFNDGTAHDSVGLAHATLHNGAQVSNGRLVLQNAGITSGQSTAVQHARLPGGILPASGSATVEVWYTTFSSTPTWQRVFDFGNQSGGSGTSYLFYTPKSSANVARAGMRGTALAEVGVGSAERANHGYRQLATVVVDAAAAQLHLYVDGVPKGSAALGATNLALVDDVYAYLGRSMFNVDAGFSGAIDELRIYNEALPAATVAAHAAAGPAAWVPPPRPARQMENLDRGIVAISRGGGQVYVGWRLLGNDPAGVAFNIYRSAGGGAAVKLNASPITATTDFVDSTANLKVPNQYFVRTVVGGVEQPAASKPFVLGANTSAGPYLGIPMQVPPGGLTRDGVPYHYEILDASVGDLDGDGAYEYVVQWESANDGTSDFRGPYLLDAYEMDGTRLWRINLGHNLMNRNDGYLVYDLDGDGKAEVVTRTADGTVSGTGQMIGDPTADWVNTTRYPAGWVMTGPEYFTVFRGQDGAALATAPLEPARGNLTDWGDDYGQRAQQLFITGAYLDGVRPSIVFSRGIYSARSPYAAQTQQVAYDWRNGQLTKRWHFKAGRGINNDVNENFVGQGNHQVSVADVDGDGRDDIINGAMVVSSYGLPLASSELTHGDALHVSDLDPGRPGQEVFGIHENEGTYDPTRPPGAAMFDPVTGRTLWGAGPGIDVGRGNAADIDPTRPGAENWGGPAKDNPTGPGVVRDVNGDTMTNASGVPLAVPASNNFLVWWDGDLTRELLDRNYINKWNWTTGGNTRLLTAQFVATSQSTKSFPALTGDLLGDWREEVVWKSADSKELRIYTTTINATNRIPTLMHDAQYRLATAWQNNAYNQPPHPSFFIGAGMAAVPQPNIYVATSATAAPAAPANLAATPTTTPAGGPQVNLTWSPVSGAAKYRIKRADNSGGKYTILADNVTSTSFTDTGVQRGGTYHYVVSALGAAHPAVESAHSNEATAAFALPSPWIAQDIGNTALAGRTTLDDGVFTVTGSGADVYNNGPDSFRFVHRTASGDGSIIARVESIKNTANHAKYGVMFRKSLATNAAFADLFVTPDGHIFFQWRGTDGGSTAYRYTYASAPVWLKLTRTGNSFSAFYGPDGVNWTQVDTAKTVVMPASTPGGLIVCSLDNFNAGVGVFSNVSVPGAASVAGSVFHDADADEIFDATEAGLADVDVYLDADNDAVHDSTEPITTTNASGGYAFADVAPGNYTVRQVAPPDYVAVRGMPVTAAVGPAVTANLATARHTYAGTAGNDSYRLRRNAAGKFEILIGGSLAYTVFAGVPSLAFNLGGGDDMLSIDLADGAPVPSGGVSFDGGATGNDTLAVVGTVGADAITFGPSAVTLAAGSIATNDAESCSFDGRGGADALDVTGGAAALAADVRLASLAVADGATLDLRDHHLILDYTGPSPLGSSDGSTYTGITGLLQRGHNGGAWDGTGIRTSMSDAPTGLTTLAVGEASDILGITGTQTATWNGQAVDASTVIVKYTYGGDTNFDGKLDADDYGTIDFSVLVPNTFGYYAGDFNFDGKVDADDYGVIDFNILAQDEIL